MKKRKDDHNCPYDEQIDKLDKALDDEWRRCEDGVATLQFERLMQEQEALIKRCLKERGII